MKAPNKPYTKSLNDELDWKLLDQLHGAVSQISSFCFEIKKFCVTTLFVVLAFIIKFTSDKLDHSIFVTGLIIPLCFWFLDATGYFYQVKLRGMMDAIRERLASDHSTKLIVSLSAKVIEPSRVKAPLCKRILAAGFNHSMWVYVMLLMINFSIWGLYHLSIIK
jgi:hypothetical protein